MARRIPTIASVILYREPDVLDLGHARREPFCLAVTDHERCEPNTSLRFGRRQRLDANIAASASDIDMQFEKAGPDGVCVALWIRVVSIHMVEAKQRQIARPLVDKFDSTIINRAYKPIVVHWLSAWTFGLGSQSDVLPYRLGELRLVHG